MGDPSCPLLPIPLWYLRSGHLPEIRGLFPEMINVNVNVNVNVNAVDLEKKPFGEDVSKRDGFDDYPSTYLLTYRNK